jgi:uncharacterized protein
MDVISSMISKICEIKKLLAKESKKNNVLLAYLFGSQIKGKIGPLSDYDFAVLLSKKPAFQFKYELKNKIVNAIDDEKVDLIILNYAPIELKYHVIATGKIIFQESPVIKTEFEADTLSKYFDYLPVLRAQKKDIIKIKSQKDKYGNRIQRYRTALRKTEEMLGKIRAL